MEDKQEKPQKPSIEERIHNLDRFPGPLSEYNELKGEEHTIMDTGRPNKYVYYLRYSGSYTWEFLQEEKKLLKKLVEAGCIGIIRYVPQTNEGQRDGQNNHGGYGIPVKKILVLEGRAIVGK